MEIINYKANTKILLSVKGHPYDRSAFFRIFEEREEIGFTAVEQPATQALLESTMVDDFDVLVFYDMPGIDFSCSPPVFIDPPESLKRRFIELTEKGIGMVFLHHAIAGWPTWEEYGRIIGGRFLYLPGELQGKVCLDSGYRHAVDYQAKVLTNHRVTRGLPDSFGVTDELYLYEVFEDDKTPVLASDYQFDAAHFNSAAAAVSRSSEGEEWNHPEGSNLIGWVKRYNNSPVVYLQMGDAPAVFDNPHYRKLVFNGIEWAAAMNGCNSRSKFQNRSN